METDSDLFDERVKFAAAVRNTCEEVLERGEALGGVSLWLDDESYFVDAEVEAIRGSVLFISERDGSIHEVDVNAVVKMDVSKTK